MNYYIYTYVISILISLFGGWLVWKQKRCISSFFFLLFTIFSSLWFVIYFIFFSWIFWPEILIYSTRLWFWTWIVAVYSLLGYIISFWDNESSIWNRKVLLSLFSFLIILWVYVFTNWIIYWLEYSASEKVYREINGTFFFLHITAHLSFLVLFIYYSFQKIKTQDNLNKIRLKNILLSAFFLVSSLIILQLILPYFWIWILEKEIIFLFTLFVISVPIIVRRYYFTHIWYWIWKLLTLATSLILAIALSSMVKYFFLHVNSSGISYWIDKNDYSILDTIFTILIYFPIYNAFNKLFLWNNSLAEVSLKIESLKKLISRITDQASLDKFIWKEIYKICSSNLATIILYNQTNESYEEIKKFFSKKMSHKVFINDIVFIEQNKKFYNKEKIQNEIPKEAFLIFPLYNWKWINIGIFIVWKKRFWDFYTLAEIDILKEFSFFLEIHLKYMRTYSAMQDLSMNLDKKVDEKTIEYNDLINRQKEFIWVISHEIRSPIWAAIFQSDSIIDDLNSNTIEPDKLKEELSILNKQLVRTWWLLSKLFSVQYYDTHTVNLFREKIEFSRFLESEIELFSHMHTGINFTSKIDKNIGFIEIDKIQFQQVINNLLDNAVKFLSEENPTISLSSSKTWYLLEVIIEDNGTWFQWVQIQDIFDKYTTWSRWTIWLWMGLYLCKKIISMHNGTIEASLSERLKGAKFTITIPLR